jgi:hypothetical protein
MAISESYATGHRRAGRHGRQDVAFAFSWVHLQRALDVHRGNKRPLVVSCGTQQSESVVVVEPGGHVGRSLAGLSTCPRGGVDPRRR